MSNLIPCASAPAVGSASPEVMSWLVLAREHILRHDFSRARACFHEAADRDRTGTALQEWGCFLYSQGEFAAAALRLRRAIDLAALCANHELRGTACNNLACVYRECGQTALASTWQQQSWKAMEADSGESGEALGCDLTNRAHDALLRGDLRLAERLYDLALRWEQRHGTTAGEAADWGSLGLVSALRGDLVSAVRRLRQALRLHRQVGDVPGVATDLLHLGEVWAQRGHWNRALLCLDCAEHLFSLAGRRVLAKKARRAAFALRRLQSVRSFDPRLN